MDVQKINNEMTYQLTMIQAKVLLNNGAIFA
ncbi:SHOCT domain-containing protein, partial [Streptococcus iniae]